MLCTFKKFVSKCCLCIPLKTGCIVIAVLNVIDAGLDIFLRQVVMKMGWHKILGIVLCSVEAFMGMIFIYGVIKKLAWIVKLYIQLVAFVIFIGMLELSNAYISPETLATKPEHIKHNLMVLTITYTIHGIIYLYFLVVICSYYVEITDDIQAEES
ncbi:hypothetical protein ILUMI_24733 [Ignelater luminosus]|uniref:Uncharacterized protein n=1 Tax=Ignelater luminosus TaxID=2038154 RepID=A0A8K0C9Y3_IGNLU|nr:hypothetical protein ILUMI_24733 [Ignelater luminosus]